MPYSSSLGIDVIQPKIKKYYINRICKNKTYKCMATKIHLLNSSEEKNVTKRLKEKKPITKLLGKSALSWFCGSG